MGSIWPKYYSDLYYISIKLSRWTKNSEKILNFLKPFLKKAFVNICFIVSAKSPTEHVTQKGWRGYISAHRKLHWEVTLKNYTIIIFGTQFEKCNVLGELVPFVQFKKVKNTHGGVVLSVKLQDFLACNLTKIITPAWLFLTFFKFYKWYQLAESIMFIFKFWILNHFSPVLHFI